MNVLHSLFSFCKFLNCIHFIKSNLIIYTGLPGSFGHTTTAPPVKKSKFKEHRDRPKFSDPEFDVEEQLESKYYVVIQNACVL